MLDDRHWLGKLAVAALCALFLPALVGGWLLYGWGVEVARRALTGQAEALPGWRKPLPYLRDGLRGALACLAYLAPVALFEAAAWALRSYAGEAGAVAATALGVLSAVWLVLVGYWLVGVTVVLARGGGLREALDLGAVRRLLRDNATPYQLAYLSMVVFCPLLIGVGALFLGVGALFGVGWAFAFAGRLAAQAYITANE